MKRLLPVILLAGLITGFIHYRQRAPAEPSALTVISSPAGAAAAPVSALSRAPDSLPPAQSRASLSLADEISRALRSGSAAEQDRALHVLLPALVASDPAAAGHLALAWEPGALRDELLREVIRLWSAADIGGAVAWLTSLLSKADHNTAATAATAQVAQSDTPGAIELSQLLGVGIDNGSLEHLAQLWAEQTPREAMAWIVTQPTGPNRDRLLARIAWVRAQSEPAEAAGLVLDHMTAGARRDDALIGVVRQWAVRDPAAAGTWVGQFPTGQLRTRALDELETARKLR